MGAIHEQITAVSLQEVASAALILEVEPANPAPRRATPASARGPASPTPIPPPPPAAVYDCWHVRRSFTSAGDAHVGTTIEVVNVSGAAARQQAAAWDEGISAHVLSMRYVIVLDDGERAAAPPLDAARILFLFDTGVDTHLEYGLCGDVALGLEHLPALEEQLRGRNRAARRRRRSFWDRLLRR